MNDRIIIKSVISIILLMMLSSCGIKSEETVIKETFDLTIETFNLEKAQEPTTELQHTKIYLPPLLEVIEEDESNIILKESDQTYLFFNNILENEMSELNFHAANNDSALLLESFKDEDKFGYIRVMPEIEGVYELQIGIGGVKITTHTLKKDMDHDAENIMKMALSTLNSTVVSNN